MAMPVLATKFFVPAPRARAVPRPRLVTALDEGTRVGRKLILISAPAGFGKTTAMSEWVAARRRLDPELRVAWLALERSDNDPARFLGYLVAALNQGNDEIGSLSDNSQASVEATMTALVNAVAQSPHRVILVLDDFQWIEDESIRAAVAFLLDHLPSTLQVAIASRSDPLLPIARLRAHDELTELRAADLRFTPAEAASFLKQTMGLSLSAADVDALETRTEGWIAGLQLAALSMRERSDVPGFIAAFAGSNRFVIDYLIEEVLERVPDDVREFLFQTAILDRLSGPLCDAVTGRTGGSDMLESLERANLFVVPMDDQRRWYRYHHLFADVLRVRLLAHDADHVSTLHSRASDWYERHDYPEDSVTHALAAHDFPRAARVIEATIPSVRKSRQDSTVLRWLNLLPRETIARRPVLAVFSAWSSLVAGDVAAVEPQLANAERLLSATTSGGTPAHDSENGEELQTLPVTIALYRAAVAMASSNLAGITEHARRALDLASADDHLGRGAATGMLGLAAWASGDLETGVRAFRDTAISLRLAGNLTDALSTTMVVGDMLMMLGRVRDTQDAYAQALHEATESGGSGPPTADLHVGIAEVLRERNELAAATEHLAASEALGEGGFSHEHRFRWFVAMARIREAEGNLDAAVDLLSEAERRYRRGFLPEVRPIAAMKARLRIAHGPLSDALAWLTEQGLASDDELSYLQEFGHITLARLLIAQFKVDGTPGTLDDATALLARLLDAAERGGRVGSVTEILMLQSLALHAQGQTALALPPLARALVHAEAEGYVRLFVDEGAPMLSLLRVAAGAGIRPDYVRRLSHVLRSADGTGPVSQPLDALSERELEVLRLLATELTGPEIARELFVSLNTMRTHTKHIFLKLDVSSRRAAVRRAEALGLL